MKGQTKKRKGVAYRDGNYVIVVRSLWPDDQKG